MISTPTVLILGAGASMPFNFPSGEGLVADILGSLSSRGAVMDRLAMGGPRAVLAEALRFINVEPEPLIDDFRESLLDSGRLSIDLFLEYHPEFLQVGKMAIASVLIPLENVQRLRSAKTNWYKFLFDKLSTNFEEFAQNDLSILTYNYDRSLEQFLFTALRNSYQGMKDDYARCWDQLLAIPIIHLHGSLGELQHSADVLDIRERAYEPHRTSQALGLCSESIRVISENVLSEELVRAHDHLSEARVVCFLGFGWDRTNLSRLEMTGTENLRKDVKLYGATFEKGKAERDWIHNYFADVGGITLGSSTQKIDEFLGDFPILF